MSTEDRSTQQTAPDRSRHPTERIAVWGVILGLCVLAGCEASARFSHQKSVEAVDDAYRSSAERISELLNSDAVRADVDARIESGMSVDEAQAAAVAEAKESNPDQWRRMTLLDAEALISGFPQKSEEPVTPYIHDVTYRWKTLLKDYGGVRVRYQIESGEILNISDFAPGEEE